MRLAYFRFGAVILDYWCTSVKSICKMVAAAGWDFCPRLACFLLHPTLTQPWVGASWILNGLSVCGLCLWRMYTH